MMRDISTGFYAQSALEAVRGGDAIIKQFEDFVSPKTKGDQRIAQYEDLQQQLRGHLKVLERLSGDEETQGEFGSLSGRTQKTITDGQKRLQEYISNIQEKMNAIREFGKALDDATSEIAQ